MSKQYGADTGASTSGVRHDTITDIVFFEIGRAVAETSLAESHLGERVMCAYEDQVPEAARTVNVEAPRVHEHDVRTFSKLEDRANKRIRDYKNGVIPLPADMVQPALSVLPEPYRGRGLRKVARYIGFIGAERPDAPEAGTDCNLLTDISNGSSQAMRLVVQALADGRLDEHDLEQAPALVAALDDLAAKAIAARARVIERTGLVTTELSVVGGRDRSA